MGPTEAEIANGMAFVDALSITERHAFLGLFAGAIFPWKSFNGRAPFIGKAECEWVEDWRDFYGDKRRTLPLGGHNANIERQTIGGFQRWVLAGLYRAGVDFADYDVNARRPTESANLNLFEGSDA